ncbi:hypothetical protein RhiLY_01280 [Ceratobasidium sp. AG-Ba]|nr:hypothetical protein RhiLY_01280 [Ceratobasidium sp. AG-Ba]
MTGQWCPYIQKVPRSYPATDQIKKLVLNIHFATLQGTNTSYHPYYTRPAQVLQFHNVA